MESQSDWSGTPPVCGGGPPHGDSVAAGGDDVCAKPGGGDDERPWVWCGGRPSERPPRLSVDAAVPLSSWLPPSGTVGSVEARGRVEARRRLLAGRRGAHTELEAGGCQVDAPKPNEGTCEAACAHAAAAASWRAAEPVGASAPTRRSPDVAACCAKPAAADPEARDRAAVAHAAAYAKLAGINAVRCCHVERLRAAKHPRQACPGRALAPGQVAAAAVAAVAAAPAVAAVPRGAGRSPAGTAGTAAPRPHESGTSRMVEHNRRDAAELGLRPCMPRGCCCACCACH